jgi:hypothetical protein
MALSPEGASMPIIPGDYFGDEDEIDAEYQAACEAHEQALADDWGFEDII